MESKEAKTLIGSLKEQIEKAKQMIHELEEKEDIPITTEEEISWLYTKIDQLKKDRYGWDCLDFLCGEGCNNDYPQKGAVERIDREIKIVENMLKEKLDCILKH